MHKAENDIHTHIHYTASAQCGLISLNNWWRQNWWRLVPSAVPVVSIEERDF